MVYTKDSDADIFIMTEAKAQRQAGAPRVVVVSGDAEISASLEYGSAMGWMTSEMYMLEMKRASHLLVHLASTDVFTCGTISMCASLPDCMLSRSGHARSRTPAAPSQCVQACRIACSAVVAMPEAGAQWASCVCQSMCRIVNCFQWDPAACMLRLRGQTGYSCLTAAIWSCSTEGSVHAGVPPCH